MAINTDVEIKAEFFRRYMTVKQMKNCLCQLQDTDILYPNRVGNLSVIRDSTKSVIGYIDFNTESFDCLGEG